MFPTLVFNHFGCMKFLYAGKIFFICITVLIVFKMLVGPEVVGDV